MKKNRFEVISINSARITVDVSRLHKSDELFFNATEMAKPFGRRPDDFWKQEQNREYLEVLITLSEGNKSDFIHTKRGKAYGGTWFHKDLALQFARWLSPEFAVRLDRWTQERITQEHAWITKRLEAKTGYLPMTMAVEQAHNDPQFYHYSNEADMINRIVLGMSAKEFKLANRAENVRDAATPEQLIIMQRMQAINTGLIEVGMCYADRKARLQEWHAKQQHQPRMYG